MGAAPAGLDVEMSVNATSAVATKMRSRIDAPACPVQSRNYWRPCSLKWVTFLSALSEGSVCIGATSTRPVDKRGFYVVASASVTASKLCQHSQVRVSAGRGLESAQFRVSRFHRQADYVRFPGYNGHRGEKPLPPSLTQREHHVA
jgi:hypothetical protein